MASVYGGSHINLVAADAKDVNGGLLSQEVEYLSAGFQARISTSQASCIREFHTGTTLHKELAMSCHIGSRAWTLQERILAPRSIYFGQQGPYWLCTWSRGTKDLPYGYESLTGTQFRSFDDDSLDWRTVIQYFSRAKLTFPSDTMSALSGLAAYQQSVTNDQYLAGMWRNQLNHQLIWSVVQQRPKSEPRGVPSWSFLSVDGVISLWQDHPDCLKQFHLQVLNAWTIPSGPNPYADVSRGELTICCPGLLRGTLCGPLEELNQLISDANIAAAAVKLDFNGEIFPINMDYLGHIESNAVVYMLSIRSGSGFRWFPKPKSNKSSNTDDDESDKPFDEDDYFNQQVVMGMILQESNTEQGYFSRTGSFTFTNGQDWSTIETDSYDDKFMHCDKFLSIFSEGCSTITAADEAAWLKVVGEEKYKEREFCHVITII